MPGTGYMTGKTADGRTLITGVGVCRMSNGEAIRFTRGKNYDFVSFMAEVDCFMKDKTTQISKKMVFNGFGMIARYCKEFLKTGSKFFFFGEVKEDGYHKRLHPDMPPQYVTTLYYIQKQPNLEKGSEEEKMAKKIRQSEPEIDEPLF